MLSPISCGQGVDGQDVAASLWGALEDRATMHMSRGFILQVKTIDQDPDVYKWYIQASAQYFQVSRCVEQLRAYVEVRLSSQVSVDEAESMVGRAPLNPMQHAISFDARGCLDAVRAWMRSLDPRSCCPEASLAEAASVCTH